METVYQPRNALNSACAESYALTVKPLWAWAIMHGHKRYENRTWITRHRGPLWIHAGRFRREDYDQAAEILRAAKIEPPSPEELPCGVILGSVQLTQCLTVHVLGQHEPFADGPYAWELHAPRLLPFHCPARGLVGVWKVPADIAALLPDFTSG